jgi:hypothetical protein
LYGYDPLATSKLSLYDYDPLATSLLSKKEKLSNLLFPQGLLPLIRIATNEGKPP